MVVVLPEPGPPVSTPKRPASSNCIAASWSGDKPAV